MSSQMYSIHLMDDACLNNIVDKIISSFFCVLLCHMGFRRDTVNCLKIATSLNADLFNFF